MAKKFTSSGGNEVEIADDGTVYVNGQKAGGDVTFGDTYGDTVRVNDFRTDD